MDNIVILGSGVASLSAAYQLIKCNHEVKIIAPDEHFNVITDGARFLHKHESKAFQSLLYDSRATYVDKELSGGVELYHAGKIAKHDWSELLSDSHLREFSTRMYAEGSGREWTHSIMNDLLGMEETPKGLVSPTYADLIHHMEDKVNNSELCTFCKGMVYSVSLAEQRITFTSEDTVFYDLLINTVPFWAFKDLLEVHLPVQGEFQYSDPRYCITEKIDSDEFSMTYYAGTEIEGQCGLPIKRVSCLNGERIIELYQKPTADQLGDRVLTKLPPNITDIPTEDWAKVIQHLHNHNVELLGRFAQMKSRMMFTDIIDSSYKLIQSLWSK